MEKDIPEEEAADGSIICLKEIRWEGINSICMA
jgi:hypothetical protein